MRRSSVLAVSTLVLMSGAALFAAEPQTKKEGTPQPVAVVAATGSNLQGRLLTTSNNVAAESPLVQAARSAMAARARNTGNRIVIDSSTLVVSRYHSVSEAAVPAVPQGRSWATAGINGDARNAREQSDKQRQAMGEQARQYQLKIEQSYMGQQHNEVYTETDEDHVTQRLNTIPVEMAQPAQPARPPM